MTINFEYMRVDSTTYIYQVWSYRDSPIRENDKCTYDMHTKTNERYQRNESIDKDRDDNCINYIDTS